jgi:multiple sugar transport system permease protein
LWLFANPLKSSDEIWTNIASLIPETFPLKLHYRVAGFGSVTFTPFTNSFIYGGGTIARDVIGAVAGFARIRFAGRSFWFTCMMLTLMLPVQVQIIPQYIIFSWLDWINTFYPLLLPRFFGPLFYLSDDAVHPGYSY